MSRLAASLIALALFSEPLAAQNPFSRPVDAVEVRFGRSQPVISYNLRVDATDLTAFDVEMRVRNAPDSFSIAMAAHPEYDDKFWRYLEGLTVQVAGSGMGSVTRADSALWRVRAPGGSATLRYRIRLPAPTVPQRAAWRPFLSPTGGLFGGPHSFLYVVGAELAPAHVTVMLPAGWDIATGLTPTSDPSTFFAASADVLVDSPIFAGRMRRWRFAVDGVPHRVVYWPGAKVTPFDTLAFVSSLEGLARQAVALFGRAPYREFTFIFQDDAFGGLEHINSVTLGAPSANLAEDMASLLGEAAHEYLHTWNLMRLRPVERTGMDWRPAKQSTGLWWSEGLTLYYADLLRRRARVPTEDSTRLAHLENAIGRYLSNPGNSHVSPERTSLFEYGAPPGSLGDYDPSPHLQGEMIGAMLDLIVRDASGGRRSMDDIMRTMMARYSGTRGFTGADIERTVAEECGCSVRAFFDRYIRAPGAIPFDRYLALMGMKTVVRWVPATDRAGKPAADLRIRAWVPPGEQRLSVLMYQPTSSWGRAGLHTGDRVTTMNGAPVATSPEFRAVLARATIGDTVHVGIMRGTRALVVPVAIAGFENPEVRIIEIASASARQRSLRDKWVSGAP